MKTSVPRVKNVKFKSGGSISILPDSLNNITRYDLGWGEVVFRLHDNEIIERRDIMYMIEAIKHMVLHND